MTNLTQAEFGLACIIAGILLLIARHWRAILFLWAMWIAFNWRDQ